MGKLFLTAALILLTPLLVPPVGMILYITSNIAEILFEQCTMAAAPFLILLTGTFLPEH